MIYSVMAQHINLRGSFDGINGVAVGSEYLSRDNAMIECLLGYLSHMHLIQVNNYIQTASK